MVVLAASSSASVHEWNGDDKGMSATIVEEVRSLKRVSVCAVS